MSKFIPCPICHGKGGEVEPVLDWGEGPYYKCEGCNDERSLEAYERIKKENFLRQEYEESIICPECHHNAAWHYKSYLSKDLRDRERESGQATGCGFTLEGKQYIETCNCTQYKEDLYEWSASRFKKSGEVLPETAT